MSDTSEGLTEFFQVLREEDSNLFSLEEIRDKITVLPFPSFCLEYLFGINGLPFERIIQVLGQQASMKSAFCVEVIRWFAQFGGGGVLLEHEGKFSPDFARSIMGSYESSMAVAQCNSIEDWQQRLQIYVSKIKSLPKKNAPFVFVVDSILGKSSIETMQAIEKQGYAGRQHPVEALKITNYLRKLASDMAGVPIVVLIVNHLKPFSTGYFTERHRAGGKHLSFCQTYELQLDRKEDIEKSAYQGAYIKFSLYKNSLSSERDSIRVPIIWKYFTDDSGKIIQQTRWLWHTATIELLMNYQEELKDLDLHVSKTKKVWSSALGIPEKEPVDMETAGEMLIHNSDVMSELRKQFAIITYKTYEKGFDYEEITTEGQEPVKKRKKREPRVQSD